MSRLTRLNQWVEEKMADDMGCNIPCPEEGLRKHGDYSDRYACEKCPVGYTQNPKYQEILTCLDSQL